MKTKYTTGILFVLFTCLSGLNVRSNAGNGVAAKGLMPVGIAQNEHDNRRLSISSLKDDSIVKVDIEAEFPGGNNGFAIFVRDNFKVPAECTEEGAVAMVQLRFVVEADGRVTNVTVKEDRSTCKPYFANEAVRILKKSPKWKPGKYQGKAVKSYRIVPIRLNLG